jgi:hypothetical protein
MIHGKPFIDLEKYVDLTEFDSLHLEISRGIATARDLAYDGLQNVPEGTMHPHAQGYKVNPLFDVAAKWNSLSEDDPFKIAGKDLTYNQLTDYLKNAYGAYDFYRLFQIIKEPDVIGEAAEHFPGLLKWIESYVTNGIMTKLHSSNLISVDAGGIPWEHYDPAEGVETEGFLPEFIHIKTDTDRPFYILDPATGERTFMNTRVSYWNERDWHGGIPVPKPTYTLRINGTFTEEFKRKTGITIC